MGTSALNEQKLKNKKIAILATHGFEQDELFEPKRALENAGASVEVIAPEAGEIKGWKSKDWGKTIKVDRTVREANADDYDGIVLPGGVLNPDQLRMNAEAVNFVKAFADEKKPIAAICHGPWTLIETGIFEHGKTVTSWPSLRSDLTNAGAVWVDQEVVVDEGLVTSRNPTDIPAFNQKMIEEFAEGKHLNHNLKGQKPNEGAHTVSEIRPF